jgi:hypothetical protein
MPPKITPLNSQEGIEKIGRGIGEVMEPKRTKTPKKDDLYLQTYGSNPWMGDRPVARPLYLHRQHKQKIHVHLSPNEIRHRDASVGAATHTTGLRQHSHSVRHAQAYLSQIKLHSATCQNATFYRIRHK